MRALCPKTVRVELELVEGPGTGDGEKPEQLPPPPPPLPNHPFDPGETEGKGHSDERTLASFDHV